MVHSIILYCLRLQTLVEFRLTELYAHSLSAVHEPENWEEEHDAYDREDRERPLVPNFASKRDAASKIRC